MLPKTRALSQAWLLLQRKKDLSALDVTKLVTVSMTVKQIYATVVKVLIMRLEIAQFCVLPDQELLSMGLVMRI
jgi:hypothetical protein